MKRLQRSLIAVLAVLCFFVSFVNADETKDPLNGLVFFKSGNSYIAYNTDGLGEQLYYSSNEKVLYEIFKTGYKGSLNSHRIFFETRNGQKGSWHYKNGEILADRDRWGVFKTRKTFKKISPPAGTTLVALPTIRIPEYLFRLPDGGFVYVSADKYHYSRESFRLFISKSDDGMKEIKVESVIRFIHGGTTTIETREGKLFSPSPWKRGSATWNSIRIERLNPAKHVIKDTGNRVQIK